MGGGVSDVGLLGGGVRGVFGGLEGRGCLEDLGGVQGCSGGEDRGGGRLRERDRAIMLCFACNLLLSLYAVFFLDQACLFLISSARRIVS